MVSVRELFKTTIATIEGDCLSEQEVLEDERFGREEIGPALAKLLPKPLLDDESESRIRQRKKFLNAAGEARDEMIERLARKILGLPKGRSI